MAVASTDLGRATAIGIVYWVVAKRSRGRLATRIFNINSKLPTIPPDCKAKTGLEFYFFSILLFLSKTRHGCQTDSPGGHL
jgi:hypothetical protein